jgi:hydrogenase maturation factor
MPKAVNHWLLNTEVLEFKNVMVHVGFVVNKVTMERFG